MKMFQIMNNLLTDLLTNELAVDGRICDGG